MAVSLKSDYVDMTSFICCWSIEKVTRGKTWQHPLALIGHYIWHRHVYLHLYFTLCQHENLDWSYFLFGYTFLVLL